MFKTKCRTCGTEITFLKNCFGSNVPVEIDGNLHDTDTELFDVVNHRIGKGRQHTIHSDRRCFSNIKQN